MPIVDIEVVENPNDGFLELPPTRSFADALGAVFGEGPGRTWVKIHALPQSSYAENGASDPDDDGDDDPALAEVFPVFVKVLHGTLPPVEILRDEARRIAATVGFVLQRPKEHVHILYLPSGDNRIAFGGVLRED